MRTSVYVDGYNLYYSKLKADPACKWLNPLSLAQAILGGDYQVSTAMYYTARAADRYDSSEPLRQSAYLDALQATKGVTVVEGEFRFETNFSEIAEPHDSKPKGYVWAPPLPTLILVSKAKEKMTDVNLASHLIRDAYTDQFDAAAVLTSDTDFAEALRVVREDAGKKVLLLCPKRKPHASLIDVSDRWFRVHRQHLLRSQLPNPVMTASGLTIEKPVSWSATG